MSFRNHIYFVICLKLKKKKIKLHIQGFFKKLFVVYVNITMGKIILFVLLFLTYKKYVKRNGHTVATEFFR